MSTQSYAPTQGITYSGELRSSMAAVPSAMGAHADGKTPLPFFGTQPQHTPHDQHHGGYASHGQAPQRQHHQSRSQQPLQVPHCLRAAMSANQSLRAAVDANQSLFPAIAGVASGGLRQDSDEASQQRQDEASMLILNHAIHLTTQLVSGRPVRHDAAVQSLVLLQRVTSELKADPVRPGEGLSAYAAAALLGTPTCLRAATEAGSLAVTSPRRPTARSCDPILFSPPPCTPFQVTGTIQLPAPADPHGGSLLERTASQGLDFERMPSWAPSLSAHGPFGSEVSSSLVQHFGRTLSAESMQDPLGNGHGFQQLCHLPASSDAQLQNAIEMLPADASLWNLSMAASGGGAGAAASASVGVRSNASARASAASLQTSSAAAAAESQSNAGSEASSGAAFTATSPAFEGTARTAARGRNQTRVVCPVCGGQGRDGPSRYAAGSGGVWACGGACVSSAASGFSLWCPCASFVHPSLVCSTTAPAAAATAAGFMTPRSLSETAWLSCRTIRRRRSRPPSKVGRLPR